LRIRRRSTSRRHSTAPRSPGLAPASQLPEQVPEVVQAPAPRPGAWTRAPATPAIGFPAQPSRSTTATT
jgi:hypothetical protein